ncbi:CGNR zinc finger domain-containing protein [Dactylosporangium sp. NPDC049525]|uniref:CGNR zinc finger domain-containing protein n=1 Tax=Dactylosporangium sp. NPDC049525 TaxID=3154730 RepID=UPI003413D5EB
MDHRPPAPGGLALVEAFLRTRNTVTSPRTLAAWLRAHDFRCGPLTDSSLAVAVGVREAIRALADANSAVPAPGPPTPSALSDPSGPAVPALDALLLEHRVTPALTGDPASPVLRWRAAGTEPGDGLPAALAVILGGVVTAIADGTWPRFKTCAADDCRYAFYDHTRNRSTRWCDVAGCGVNSRMRAYRTRRRPA